MKITHIVSTYPPYKSGMGNVTERTVNELKQRGHKIKVLTPDYNRARESYDYEEIERIKPAFAYGNSAFVPKLYSHLKDVDLIHLHYPFFGGAETVARFKKNHPQIPLVITYHMDVEGSGLLKAFFLVYGKTLLPWILNKADKIIVSSKDYAEYSKFLNKKYFEKMIEIPFGVDRRFEPATDRSESNNIELLFVAALDKAHYFKGLDYLLPAFAKVVQNREQSVLNGFIKLNVVGDGDLRAMYEAQAKELGIDGWVNFLGRVTDEDLIKAYQYADITLKPSIDRSEAFGVTLIESMACGTPVIATNLPGVRTVLDEKTGLLVPVKDSDALAHAIEVLINDPEKLKQMRIAAVERVEYRYRWPKIIDRLEQIYQELV